MMTRRSLFGFAASLRLALGQERADWAASDLIQPEELAAQLKHDPPQIVHVGFPALYHGAHIAGSVYAGPGSKQEGLDLLRKWAGGMQKTQPIVLYCGCCPWERCPNVRPAFQALRQLGFQHVKAMVIPTNLHTDWIEKGYPVERGQSPV